MHVSECTFSNFSLIQSPDQRCFFQEPFSYKEQTLEDDGLSSSDVDHGGSSQKLLVMDNGCAQIMMCLSRSSCSMTYTSLCNVEMMSESMVYIDRPDVSDYYFSNNILVDDGSRSGFECQLTTGVLVENVPDTTTNQQQQQQPAVGVGGVPSSSTTATNTEDVSASTPTCIEEEAEVAGAQIFEILSIDSGGWCRG